MSRRVIGDTEQVAEIEADASELQPVPDARPQRQEPGGLRSCDRSEPDRGNAGSSGTTSRITIGDGPSAPHDHQRLCRSDRQRLRSSHWSTREGG